MANPVKYIEKEFLFKVLHDEKLPIVFRKDGIEYLFFLDKVEKNELYLTTNRSLEKIKIRECLNFMFDYRGKAIIFTAEVLKIKDSIVTCAAPEYLYKDLSRTYTRVELPDEMQIQFSFMGDRYNLSFPKVMEYEHGEISDIINNFNTKNISGLIDQMASWIKKFASGYRLVIFKDVKPSSTEECVVAETGKTLFLPSMQEGFPLDDPFPRKRIITNELFRRYLESTGIGMGFMDSACARFLKAKAEGGIESAAWVPVLFQEYVVGYIHIWINEKNKPPLDYKIIETMYQFAKVLAYSLKINGYFESGRIQDHFFEGKIIDISASGLLFTSPLSGLSSSLLPETKLVVKIITPNRSISINAAIVRRFKENSHGYFGCQFNISDPEDLQYLFEYIYKKPFTSSDAVFLTGQV